LELDFRRVPVPAVLVALTPGWSFSWMQQSQRACTSPYVAASCSSSSHKAIRDTVELYRQLLDRLIVDEQLTAAFPALPLR
jgi:hypothetical protein